MANTTSKNWINAKALNAPELEEKCRARLQARLSQGLFEEQDLDNISKRKISLIEGEFCTSDDRLEKLRRLCQLWDVNLNPGEITSHRPIIGPFIVAFKKMLLPIMRMLFKRTLRQQRDFNAAAISLMADLINTRKQDLSSSTLQSD